MASDSGLLYWIWLSLRVPPGSSAGDLLLDRFGDARGVYRASVSDLQKVRGLPSNLIAPLSDKHASDARAVFETCEEKGYGILTPDMAVFPGRLRDIRTCPLILYYRGSLPDFSRGVYIAAVGTRRFTPYGQREGYNVAFDLAQAGVTIVSGMAKGLDSVCHRAALDTGGMTIAVLGCGIDIAYPAENRGLMEEIAKNGLILTEYPPGTPPKGSNFPIRNRIISGLCQGTFVIEADHTSGALITARTAQEQGRTVFALPGPVGERESSGTNDLICDYALPVVSALDILQEYRGLYDNVLRLDLITAPRRAYARSSEYPSGEEPAPTAGGPRGKKTSRGKKEAGAEKSPQKKSESAGGAGKPASADEFTPIVPPSPSPGRKKSKAAPPPEQAPAPPPPQYPAGSPEAKLLTVLRQGGEMTADNLAKAAAMPVQDVLPLLTILEMEGAVESLPGGKFRSM